MNLIKKNSLKKNNLQCFYSFTANRDIRIWRRFYGSLLEGNEESEAQRIEDNKISSWRLPVLRVRRQQQGKILITRGVFPRKALLY